MGERLRWNAVEDERQMALFSEDNALERRGGVGAFDGVEFLHVKAKKIINEVPGRTPAPYRFTINPYRGCSHACVYCFARPTHAYLDLGIGEDFDNKIVVKINAVERLRAELSRSTWSGEGIAMGTNTDPYQRAEGKYRITRGLIETLGEHRNPFSILTKSTLVTRDLDVLVAASQVTHVQVAFSIPTLDPEVWKQTEPGTPHPKQRVAALARLREAGLECGVLMAPVLPGLSDARHQLKEVVAACTEAGASWIAGSGLHLKPGVKQHWMTWLEHSHPELLQLYEELYAKGSFLPAAHRQRIAGSVRGMQER